MHFLFKGTHHQLYKQFTHEEYYSTNYILQLYNVFCGSGGGLLNNPDDVLVISPRLSQLAHRDYTFITESLHYKLGAWNLTEVGVSEER